MKNKKTILIMTIFVFVCLIIVGYSVFFNISPLASGDICTPPSYQCKGEGEIYECRLDSWYYLGKCSDYDFVDLCIASQGQGLIYICSELLTCGEQGGFLTTSQCYRFDTITTKHKSVSYKNSKIGTYCCVPYQVEPENVCYANEQKYEIGEAYCNGVISNLCLEVVGYNVPQWATKDCTFFGGCTVSTGKCYSTTALGECIFEGDLYFIGDYVGDWYCLNPSEPNKMQNKERKSVTGKEGEKCIVKVTEVVQCNFGCDGGVCLGKECNKDSDCEINEVCDDGICKKKECETNTDCNDNDPCTADRCISGLFGNKCEFEEVTNCEAKLACEAKGDRWIQDVDKDGGFWCKITGIGCEIYDKSYCQNKWVIPGIIIGILIIISIIIFFIFRKKQATF